jgi:methionyl-tRNA formyltransferase
LSVRCTQIFRKEITEAVKRGSPFLNLHSGLLPDYRGVMPTMRRMFDIASGNVSETDYGCTLHKVDYFDSKAVDKGIDTGKIIEIKSIALNSSHSGYLAQVGLVEAGSESLIRALSEIENNYTLRGYPQNNAESAYYTFPSRKELAEWKNVGIVLVRPDDAVQTMVNAFSRANTRHGDKLTTVINQAIQDWRSSSSCGCKDGSVLNFPSDTGHNSLLGGLPSPAVA